MELENKSTVKIPSKHTLWVAREALIKRQHHFNRLHVRYPERLYYMNKLDEIEQAYKELEAFYFSIEGSKPFENKELID
jgi:hypothetical protein